MTINLSRLACAGGVLLPLNGLGLDGSGQGDPRKRRQPARGHTLLHPRWRANSSGACMNSSRPLIWRSPTAKAAQARAQRVRDANKLAKLAEAQDKAREARGDG